MIACVLVGIPAGPVLAQNAATKIGNNGGGLEEITVTAQRREEKLQNVPLAISAFTADQMEARQIHETLDLVHTVPNLVGHNNVGTGNANTYYLRGLGSTESLGVFDPPVGTYVDEVYIARQNVNNFSFFDVERIEVLRGPQGTLFGRNTTGGAINVILRKPSNQFGGYAEATYGRYNMYGGQASVDIPVIEDRLLTKLSAYGYHDDGYATQVLTGKKINYNHSYGIRGAARLLPSDTVTWDVAIDSTFSDHSNQLNVIDPVTGKRVSHSGLITGAIAPYITGGKAYNDALASAATSTSVTSNLRIDLRDVTLNSISGYRISRQKNNSDSQAEQPQGAFPTGAQPANSGAVFKQFSEELKATGKLFNDRVDYVAGLYFFRENDTADLGSPQTSVTNVVTVLADRTVKNSTRAKAAYTQLDFHVLDQVTLTGGVRYTDETKDVGINTNPGALGAKISSAGILAAGNPLTLNTKLVTPRFAIEYKPTEDIMLFASSTRGFKSGGWNGRSTSNASTTPFLPEKIWSEEIGIRSEWFDKKLRVNLTGFYGYTEHIQLSAAVLVNNIAIYNITNPADLRNYGAELEMTWLPIEKLTLNASLGLQNAEYTNVAASVAAQSARCKAKPGIANADCNASFVTVNGDIATPARSPKMSLNLLASYDLETNFGTLTPTAGISVQSAMAIGSTGSKASSKDPNPRINGAWVNAQTLVNLSLRYQPAFNRNLSFTAECRNCFLRDYPVSFLAPFQFLDKPGTWDVRVRYRF